MKVIKLLIALLYTLAVAACGGGTSSPASTAHTITGTESVLWSFGGSGDGANPYASPIQASDGNLYGTNPKGGANGNAGTVFKITKAGAETVLWSFGGSGDGTGPYASLIQASDGNLYGTTYGGVAQIMRARCSRSPRPARRQCCGRSAAAAMESTPIVA